MNPSRPWKALRKQLPTRSATVAANSVFFLVSLGLTVCAGRSAAQTPDKVDFANEVQPLLRENCFDCHGPSKQKADMRLDRRSSALKAFSRRVVPGSSANS